MNEALQSILAVVVELGVHLFEFAGVFVIIKSGVVGICNGIRKDPLIRLKLAQGMATGLEFKLGSEILRTVVVRDFQEIALVGAIIVLRGALTFLIHWEIKNEQAHADTIPEIEKNAKMQEK